MHMRHTVSHATAAMAMILAVAMLTGCTVKYSLSGASIPVEAKTVSIAYFPNNAAMVAPILSSTLTEALQDKFSRQTRLQLVTEGGDLAFEGEIINYTSVPTAISGNETAALNRLTITIRVKFTNVYEPEYNFNQSFQAFADYNANSLLQDVQNELIEEIVKQLVEDVFNKAVSNW